jgi:excisionase family DNA binding protein
MKTYSTFLIARLLQVDPGSIANWIDQGLLKAHRTPGRHRRVLRTDLLDFLHRQQMPVPPQLEIPPARRVLIVDSDRAVIETIRLAIQNTHPEYEILEASDGFRAGALLTGGKPDVVVLDLKMPGLDAFDVCRLIKSQPQTSHIYVVATSPKADHVHNRKEILRCGAEACLTKPLDVPALMKEMQPLLRDARL